VVVLLAVCYATQPHSTEDFLKTLVSSIFLFASSLVVLGMAGIRAVVLVLSVPSVLVADTTMLYQGKVMVILGASSGIGKDIALAAAEKGATLVLAARRVDKLEQVAEECRAAGAPKVDVLRVDVSVAEQTQACVDHVKKTYGKLDVLVLNAAIPGPWAIVEDITDVSMLHNLMDINYWGYVTPTLQSIPLLKNSSGHIVVVSSMYGHIISPYQAVYCAAKHALHGFFDVLRQELRGHVGVTVHCPGGIATEVLSKFQTGNASVQEFYIPEFFFRR